MAMTRDGQAMNMWMRRVGLAAAGVVLVVAIGSVGGCYSRVVGASGPGAQGRQIEEPYQENTWIDRQVYGDKPIK